MRFSKPNKNKCWFTEKCKKALEERNDARLKLLNILTEENKHNVLRRRANAQTRRKKPFKQKLRLIEENCKNKNKEIFTRKRRQQGKQNRKYRRI